MRITRRDIQHAMGRARSLQSRATSAAKSGGLMQVAVRQGESGAAAFGYGVLEGRYGPIKVGPFSGDFVAGLLLHLAGVTDLAGGASEHAHNLAQGFIDGYLHRIGTGIGNKLAQAKVAANPPAPPQVAAGRGHRGIAAGFRDLTRAEIATMAEEARR